MHPMSEFLREKGHAVYEFRPNYLGPNPKSRLRINTNWDSYAADAQALIAHILRREPKDRFYIVAISLGANIARRFAEEAKDGQIQGLVMISAAFAVNQGFMDELKTQGIEAPTSLYAEDDTQTVTLPTLWLSGTEDKVIDPKRNEILRGSVFVGRNTVVDVKGVEHGLSRDPRTWEAVSEWLEMAQV